MQIPFEQVEFVEDRGTKELVVNVRPCNWNVQGQNIPLCFTDYAKAFYCVSHGYLLEVMVKMGFSQH